jgi:hypothetical protein
MLKGPAGVAVVSATYGTIIDFGAEGGPDAMVSLEPTVYVGLDDMVTVVETVEAAGAEGTAVLVRKRVLSDPPLRLWTYATFRDGGLRIESVATAEAQPAVAVTVGEIVRWGNVPTWVEGYGFAHDKATLGGDFLAREGLGVAYALENEGGHIVARFGKPQPGFHEFPHSGEVTESVAAWGTSRRRTLTLTHAPGSLGAAVAKLPRMTNGPAARFPLPTHVADGTMVEVARCDGRAGDMVPFARFDARGAELAVPPSVAACGQARLVASGRAPGAWGPLTSLATAPAPAAGTLRWHVRDHGDRGVIPARIVVRGIAGTPDPSWGDDSVKGAALNVLHTDRDAAIDIPPGRYHAMVTRGFEYTQYETDLTIAADKATELDAELDHVVDTQGWITADLHVHAVPSPDAPVPLEERVQSLAAAGVEVAVATDHNGVTDYGPAIRERGLSPWLASIVGDEVTTRGAPLGHFNVFPLAPGAAPIAFDHVTPQALVAAARAAPAGADGGAGDKIVQLNHPLMGSIGYLELLHFDPRDVAAWKARSPLAEMGFDAIEVFNGDHYADLSEVRKVMSAWYALLDAGIHATATGNSDSHRVTYHECGVPRNLVRVGNDDPAHLDERAFLQAIREGRVVVSSGILVRLDVAGHGPGETVAAGPAGLHVTADAPPWIDVSRVELVSHGRVLHAWVGPFSRGVRRLDATFTATLVPGDWVIAVASGDAPMRFLPRDGAKPFAFTNPIWTR